MNFVKHVLLILTLSMPVAYADNKQPWYTRIFANSPATLIVGTAATTGILTSLAWYYFGIRPVRKHNEQIKQAMKSKALLSDMHEIALLQRDLIKKLDTQCDTLKESHTTYVDNKKSQAELLFKKRQNPKRDFSILNFAIEANETKLKNYGLEQEKNDETIAKLKAKLGEKLDQTVTVSFWENLPETVL